MKYKLTEHKKIMFRE